MKNLTPKKKVMRIIHIAMWIFLIPLVALQFYVCKRFNIPVIIGFICILPIFWGFVVLLSKWLEKSKWKDTIEEMEKDNEKEEAKPKPITGIFGLILLSIICLGYSVCNGIETLEGIFSNHYESEYLIKIIVPDCIGILTLLACSILVVIIAYNVYKKRIFTRTNARLIYSIGAILIFSIIIQNHYWETTTMLPNDTVALNFSLFGAFIIFFGRVFHIGVRIKEEQDLTI